MKQASPIVAPEPKFAAKVTINEPAITKFVKAPPVAVETEKVKVQNVKIIMKNKIDKGPPLSNNGGPPLESQVTH